MYYLEYVLLLAAGKTANIYSLLGSIFFIFIDENRLAYLSSNNLV